MSTIDDVRQGDVLLFRGRGWIPWAIRVFDGGSVNHAAIALGGGELAEAAAQGLRVRSIEEATNDVAYTEIRRHDAAELAEVVTRARLFVDSGHRYAYHQIVLLALLGVTRRIPVPRLAKRVLRSALDHAATALGDLVPTGASRMICSEYVYRCFDEATTTRPNPYALGIDLGAVFADPGGDDGTWLEWGLAQDDRRLAIAPTFGGGEPFDLQAATAELETEIAAYAVAARLAGQLSDVELPDEVAVDVEADVGPRSPIFADEEPTDDELLKEMARFGVALQDTSDANPGARDVTFGFGVEEVIAVTVLGALQGILDVSTDSNFVTPRDLAMSPTLALAGRIP